MYGYLYYVYTNQYSDKILCYDYINNFECNIDVIKSIKNITIL